MAATPKRDDAESMRYLTTTEAAAYAGVDVHTVWTWHRNGQLAGRRTRSEPWRFRQNDVDMLVSRASENSRERGETVLVPRELLEQAVGHIGALRIVGEQLAEARERADRAERVADRLASEVSELRWQLAANAN